MFKRGRGVIGHWSEWELGVDGPRRHMFGVANESEGPRRGVLSSALFTFVPLTSGRGRREVSDV